ncbi:alpha/beta fold hydrolase [Paraburkholderia fungorum]|uniref:alpha/beta fold hydrolase n=1 Tax=Paraburkholderia fungorum TaxID=134537 RepID=UPI0038BAA615
MQCETLICRNMLLSSGETLPEAKLVYATAGRLNDARDNVILYPTSFGSSHVDIAWLVGPGRPLDTDRYFVILANMLGNGLSSSPSHYPPGMFPSISVSDSVKLQHSLVHDVLRVARLALVVGFSMGGQQAYHWAALFPETVERAAIICASARTSVHNQVFLEGLKAALTLDPAWNGRYFSGAAPRGIRAMAQVYAGWGMSAEFYRRALYLTAGYRDLEDFVTNDWGAFLARTNPNDLLAMIDAWHGADISNNARYKGALPNALDAIQARCLVMPSLTDMYFSAAEICDEARQINNVDIHPIDTIWGHRVNNPRQNPDDARLVERKLTELLSYKR